MKNEPQETRHENYFRIDETGCINLVDPAEVARLLAEVDAEGWKNRRRRIMSENAIARELGLCNATSTGSRSLFVGDHPVGVVPLARRNDCLSVPEEAGLTHGIVVVTFADIKTNRVDILGWTNREAFQQNSRRVVRGGKPYRRLDRSKLFDASALHGLVAHDSVGLVQ